MKEVVDILMRRDGLSRTEAKSTVEYAVELMQDAIMDGDYMQVEEIMYEELGLEMDYAVGLLGFF